MMVTVIIPCYNSENFIARAIESVLAQTYTSWNLLLVNNNSTDRTSEILDDYQKRYPNKITVLTEQKKGAPAARNWGLANATGKWIQYLDADDELLPSKIENQINKGETFNIDCVIGNAIIRGVKNGVNYEAIRPLNVTDKWEGLITSKIGITSAILWKREMLEVIGGWDEKLSSSQEYDMMFRLFKAGAKSDYVLNADTVVYRVEGSISQSSDQERLLAIIDNRIKLRLRIREYLSETNQLTKTRNECIDIYINSELTNNGIDVRRYEKAKMDGRRLTIPVKILLKNHLNRAKKLLLNSVRNL